MADCTGLIVPNALKTQSAYPALYRINGSRLQDVVEDVNPVDRRVSQFKRHMRFTGKQQRSRLLTIYTASHTFRPKTKLLQDARSRDPHFCCASTLIWRR